MWLSPSQHINQVNKIWVFQLFWVKLIQVYFPHGVHRLLFVELELELLASQHEEKDAANTESVALSSVVKLGASLRRAPLLQPSSTRNNR